jgi:hypothetical protein
VDEVGRHADGEADGHPSDPLGRHPPDEGEGCQGEGDHEVRSVEEAGPGEEPGTERSPTRPAVVDGVAAAQPEVHGPQPEGDRPHPREGGEAGRRDDDEERDQCAQQGERPAPQPGDGEDGEHEADVLGEADEPLGRQRDAEHLEDPCEHPERARPVEVEEVLVGDRPSITISGKTSMKPSSIGGPWLRSSP